MKTIIASILSIAIILAPQYSAIIPAKYEVYAYGVLGVYEVVARLSPTTRNISLLSQIIKLLQLLFPNYSSQTKTITTDKHE